MAAAAGIVLLVAAMVWEITRQAIPAIMTQGAGFLVRDVWDAANANFGILPEIWGTLYSSLLALLIGGFFGVTIAIFLTAGLPVQYASPPSSGPSSRCWPRFRAWFTVFGASSSSSRCFAPPPTGCTRRWDGFHLFGTSLSGPGLFPAALVLAIMVLPTVAAISQDALHQVPYKVKEAAYGMGTTRWEAIFKVLLPTASGGIFSGLVLGFGRALGETMALAMLIGNANQISLSLFAPANTLASLMASNFPEAGTVERQTLMYAGLALLAVTLTVDGIGSYLRSRTQRQDQS